MSLTLLVTLLVGVTAAVAVLAAAEVAPVRAPGSG